MGRREWYRSICKAGEEEVPAAGCMSGMLQFFDFHHILLAAAAATKSGGSTSSRSAALCNSLRCQHHPQLKGVEAPRNSLELDEAAAAKTTSTASALGAEEYYGIPIGIQLVKPAPCLTKTNMKRKTNLMKDLQLLLEEEKENHSQCETPRTPNVVARLMGLEILPDGASTPTALLDGFKSQHHSPKIDGADKKMMNARKPLQKMDANLTGPCSLPDTPRASSERSRDLDPRISLQIKKENIYRATYFCDVSHSVPPSPRKKECINSKIQDENHESLRSRYGTRENVKQVKENVSRRGSSIDGADENVLVRSGWTRPADKKVLSVEDNNVVECPKPQAPPKQPRPQCTVQFKVGEHVGEKPEKCTKASCERYTERIKRQPPLSETANQSHVLLPTHPLSSAYSNLEASPPKNGCGGEKIKSRHSVTATSAARRVEASYGQRTPPFGLTSATLVVNPTQEQQPEQHRRLAKDEDPEFLYVRSILEHAGIMTSPTHELRWYSPSLPIDPFVFHQLERDLSLFRSQILHRNENLSLLGPLRHRCNRKLLFHLVEEVLGDLLTWSTSTKAHKKQLHEINKDLLLERLWSQITSFPSANCQIIEDIDALVANDLAEAKVRRLLHHPLVVAEAEDVMLEIEGDVVDSVVAEAATSLALCRKF